MKSIQERIFESILLEKLNLKDIPDDTSLDIDNIKEYKGTPKYKLYKYFGDCKNTVDVDHMWDATQMSNWIYDRCEVINPILILDKIQDGDRKIPKKALKIIDKLKSQNKLEDTSEITCALDDYQKIMFIYLSDTDTHYFFDCK